MGYFGISIRISMDWFRAMSIFAAGKHTTTTLHLIGDNVFYCNDVGQRELPYAKFKDALTLIDTPIGSKLITYTMLNLTSFTDDPQVATAKAIMLMSLYSSFSDDMVCYLHQYFVPSYHVLQDQYYFDQMMIDAYGAAAANDIKQKIIKAEALAFPIPQKKLATLLMEGVIKFEKIFVFPSSK